jgi:superfamily II DNA or RNA helicase
MSVRDKIQKEIVEAIKSHKFNCIIDVIPRTGKSKAIIDCLKLLPNKKILISAPYVTTLDSWKKEFVKWDYKGDVTLTTAVSLGSHELDDFDLIIIDECHLLSPAKLAILKASKTSKILMSGTISSKTLDKLRDSLKLKLAYEYGIEQGIKDKIVSDIEINIVSVPLDNKRKYIKGGNKANPFLTTEKQNYEYNSKRLRQAFAITKKTGNQDYVKLVAGARARAIYAYESKIEWTKKLIAKLPEKKLIFTKLTANDLCEHKHDSKTKEDNLSLFIENKITELQVCQMVSVGITILDLKLIIVHQFDSSSQTGMQKLMRAANYVDGEKAIIYMMTYQDTQDEVWVQKAVSMFPDSKINYIHYKNI